MIRTESLTGKVKLEPKSEDKRKHVRQACSGSSQDTVVERAECATGNEQPVKWAGTRGVSRSLNCFNCLNGCERLSKMRTEN